MEFVATQKGGQCPVWHDCRFIVNRKIDNGTINWSLLQAYMPCKNNNSGIKRNSFNRPMVTTMQWMKQTPMWNKSEVTLLVGEHFPTFPFHAFKLIPTYLTSWLSHFRHSGTWVQVFRHNGITGLDIVGIIRPDCYQPSRSVPSRHTYRPVGVDCKGRSPSL